MDDDQLDPVVPEEIVGEEEELDENGIPKEIPDDDDDEDDDV